MQVEITNMVAADYDEALALWKSLEDEGLGLTEDDSREDIEAFLRRNPGTCFVAREDGRLIGAVLCGHDGRRAMIYHLAVARSHRRMGLGKELMERCISGLEEAGIRKCNIVVKAYNEDGLAFWKAQGWFERPDLTLMQIWTDGRPNRQGLVPAWKAPTPGAE